MHVLLYLCVPDNCFSSSHGTPTPSSQVNCSPKNLLGVYTHSQPLGQKEQPKNGQPAQPQMRKKVEALISSTHEGTLGESC